MENTDMHKKYTMHNMNNLGKCKVVYNIIDAIQLIDVELLLMLT